jgi:hypothetical protein
MTLEVGAKSFRKRAAVKKPARACHPGWRRAAGDLRERLHHDGQELDVATEYVRDCGPTWRQTPGAVAWLNKLVAALPKKPRASRTDPQ